MAHERWVLRTRSFSRSITPRTVYVAGALIVLLAAVMFASLSIGEYVIAPADLLAVLAGDGSRRHGFIVGILRMPRLAMACLVGAALGLSGLILQSVVRNPLASPDILGITGGASAAAVGYMSLLAPAMGMRWLPLAAILGAGLTAALVYALAYRQGTSPLRLVLTGVGVSAVMAATTTWLMVTSPLSSTLSAYVWLAGSVFGASWSDVGSMFLWLCAIVPVLAYAARTVDIFDLEDGMATGLGVNVEVTRLWLLVLAVALAGAAVAHAGAIGFAGLIAPHVARALVARTFAGLTVATALVGALLVATADLAARTLFLPLDLPAGLFVSGLGAAFFVYLLARQAR